jgi:UDP-perosamine 4-acetyltransferase
MGNKSIYILGVGHNTAVYIDLVESLGYEILGLFHYDDSRTGEVDHGFSILGSFEDMFAQGVQGKNFALSMGNNSIREELFNRIISNGGNVPTLIHPTAMVSRFAQLGTGVVCHMNVIVHPDVIVGDNSVLSFDSSVSHVSSVGKNCYIAAKALIGAYVHIEDNVFIGLSATVVSGKVERIGSHSIIGAGALVINTVPCNVVVAGVPAKVLKNTPPLQFVNKIRLFVGHHSVLINRKEAA